jgi:RNA polymerase sigma factor (sigma-70 family)
LLGAGEEGPLRFQTTSWSVIRRATAGSEASAREALGRLCETYWPPVYAFVRRRGHAPADAEDLTQAYFARFFEKGYVHDFRSEKGRFRTFLLTSVSHFLANEWDRGRARKRGGGRRPISLDAATAEERLRLEPADHLTPELAFERQWTAAVLARCLERLRREEEAGGGRDRFELLKPCICGDGVSGGYATLARELSVSEAAVRVAVHRLRRRFCTVLREEVAETLVDRADVDAEIRWLLATVRAGA